MVLLAGLDAMHSGGMTDLLDQAVAHVRTLPPETQDEFALVLTRLAGGGDAPVYELTPEEDADLAEADAEIERGELATDDQVRALWTMHGL